MKAHQAVAQALRKGTLSRPETCSQCGQDGELDAHHADYTKPLDVEWLCRKCHADRHTLPADKRRDISAYLRLTSAEMDALTRLQAAAELDRGKRIPLSEIALELITGSERFQRALATHPSRDNEE